MKAILTILSFFLTMHTCYAGVVSREGKGFLEKSENQLILHVSGTPYQMGFQHGKLLKDKIGINITKYLDQTNPDFGNRIASFTKNVSQLIEFIPTEYIEEMKGLAEGSGIPYEKIVLLNLFPEMFHCSGIVVSGDATKDGSAYHARVLDYAVGKDLQESAVLIVAKPKEKTSFVSVSYAGFIGVITGINNQKIAIGEIGGQGYGFVNGVPMSFLLRSILENVKSINDAKQILETSPRTCEYYYAISDGKTNESIGVYATESQIGYITPGSSYALLAPHNLPKNYGTNGLNDKFFVPNFHVEHSSHQTVISGENPPPIALLHTQPKDTVVITGYSYAERYPLIIERILADYGSIDETILQQIIKKPVARPSNLHNAIFHPASLSLWVAHAGMNSNEPACCQDYSFYSVEKLLSSK